MKKTTIAVVGNPNCGKTTLFNALTGARQHVGNWPGVTVEKKTGRYVHDGRDVEVVDLPGTYSLSQVSETSKDESIARDFVASRQADLVVNIVDASNLERNLYLTTQLLEMRVPMVVALNMMDVAEARSLEIDVEALSRRLGCKVVAMVASRRRGLDGLKSAIDKAADEARIPEARIEYLPEVEEAISALAPALAGKGADPRWLALQLLEGDRSVRKMVEGDVVASHVAGHLDSIEARLKEDLDIILADSRYGFIGEVVKQAVRRKDQLSRTTTDRIDRVVLHRALGIPIFLGLMYLMFLFTINIGGAFIDFFDILAGTLFVDLVAELLGGVGAPEWLIAVLADGVGGGIQTVATFIPVIAFLYLFLSVLEDSGYMARAAFVMDRMMRGIGLPGKAFVPLIVGFGCNVPAAMAARTMDNERDRIVTVMMAPFMSCGARLPVYALFAAAFFPVGGQNVVFSLYLIGILVAVLTGLVLKNTLLRGDAQPFVMELPPYHMPTIWGVMIRTWERLKTFILKAGKVIVAVVVVLGFLNSWGTDGSFGNQDSENSVLSAIGKSLTPAFAPVGISEENWPATVGIFTGIFAKEAVVGTLDALYGAIAAEEAGEEEEETEFDLLAGITEAFATIPENLAGVADALLDPLGLGIVNTENLDEAAEEQGVAIGTFGAMARLFDGQAGAFAYMLMVLLYMPCVAAIAAIWRETGTGWTMFAVAWTSSWAYGAAVLAYQIGTFASHPASSAAWIAAVALVMAAVVGLMRYLGRGGNAPIEQAGKAAA